MHIVLSKGATKPVYAFPLKKKFYSCMFQSLHTPPPLFSTSTLFVILCYSFTSSWSAWKKQDWQLLIGRGKTQKKVREGWRQRQTPRGKIHTTVHTLWLLSPRIWTVCFRSLLSLLIACRFVLSWWRWAINNQQRDSQDHHRDWRETCY